ncbi:MAG: hypothetical protein IJJ40_06900 [Clostridia bacterium]|nr:hypothetical protein [Clostridia bacterium]
MTYTTIVKREDLSKLLLSDDMAGSIFKVTISPITEDEIDEIEFKSLKGIAGEPLDIDEVRKERLGL